MAVHPVFSSNNLNMALPEKSQDCETNELTKLIVSSTEISHRDLAIRPIDDLPVEDFGPSIVTGFIGLPQIFDQGASPGPRARPGPASTPGGFPPSQEWKPPNSPSQVSFFDRHICCEHLRCRGSAAPASQPRLSDPVEQCSNCCVVLIQGICPDGFPKKTGYSDIIPYSQPIFFQPLLSSWVFQDCRKPRNRNKSNSGPGETSRRRPEQRLHHG